MATEQSFIDYVLDQAGLADRLTYRKMFGEFGFYLDGKFIAMACDNSFFTKPTEATSSLAPTLPQRPPYKGAKPHPVADELLDDPQTLKRLLEHTATFLPVPVPLGRHHITAAAPLPAAKRAPSQSRRTHPQGCIVQWACR
ncbi:MAG: TfoX family protein [Spirochaetaceae bacterium]|nr:MAG: TfoX family protein [Spirochaetaceae bacterium]